MTNNLLDQSSLVKSPFLLSLLEKIRTTINIFNKNVAINSVITSGNIIAAEGHVRVLFYDCKSGKSVICPKVGRFMSFEYDEATAQYTIYFETEEGIVVDTIVNGEYKNRRNLLANLKYPIKSIISKGQYILVADEKNDMYVVAKDEVFLGDVSQILRSTSFIADRKNIFSKYSRIMSGFYKADLFIEENSVNVLIIGGSSKSVYSMNLDKDTLYPISKPTHIISLKKVEDVNLEAVHSFLSFAKKEMLDMSLLTVISASHDGTRSCISCYNKVSKNYDHSIISNADGEVKLDLKFTTNKYFACHKVTNISYGPDISKFLCMNFSGSYITYMLVNTNGNVDEQGTSKISVIEKAMIRSASQLEADAALMNEGEDMPSEEGLSEEEYIE